MNFLPKMLYLSLRIVAAVSCAAMLGSAAMHYAVARWLLDDDTLERVESGHARGLGMQARPTRSPSSLSSGRVADALQGTSPQPSIAGQPFCPTCGPVHEVETHEGDTRRRTSSLADASLAVPPSRRPLQLLSTLVAPAGQRSVAVIEHTQLRTVIAASIGDAIAPGLTVQQIDHARVILSAGGVTEFLDIEGNDCTPDFPCSEGVGDCNEDADCLTGLVCGKGAGVNYGLAAGDDACVPEACDPNPHPPFARPFCSETCRCANGFGDCDGDEECLPGLVCPDNNGPRYGQPHDWDICVAEHCFNRKRDVDETEVDCGGRNCGPCPAQ